SDLVQCAWDAGQWLGRFRRKEVLGYDMPTGRSHRVQRPSPKAFWATVTRDGQKGPGFETSPDPKSNPFGTVARLCGQTSSNDFAFLWLDVFGPGVPD